MDIEVLRRAPLFATLDDEAFRLLTDELTEVDLSRGASVFREGDPGDRLYFIVTGKVKLHRTSPDGRENTARRPRPRRAVRRAVAVRPGPAHRDRHRAHRGQAPRARPRRPPALAERPPRGGHRPAARRRPPPAQDQRPDVRPGLLRRPGPRGQGAAGPVAPLRRAAARTASTSPTTSPRRSWPSWSAPPARRSTRPSPTSRAAAGCAWRPAPWSCSTWSASPAFALSLAGITPAAHRRPAT